MLSRRTNFQIVKTRLGQRPADRPRSVKREKPTLRPLRDAIPEIRVNKKNPIT